MTLKKIFAEGYYKKAEFPADFKCPKPEDSSEMIKYAFTLNPKEQCFDLMTHKHVIAFYDELKEMLIKLRGCSIMLVVELSVRARLHFHGYITITNKMLFYFHDLNIINSYGNACIEPITDPTIWDLYIYKNRDMMSEWLSLVNVSHLHLYELHYDSRDD